MAQHCAQLTQIETNNPLIEAISRKMPRTPAQVFSRNRGRDDSNPPATRWAATSNDWEPEGQKVTLDDNMLPSYKDLEEEDDENGIRGPEQVTEGEGPVPAGMMRSMRHPLQLVCTSPDDSALPSHSPAATPPRQTAPPRLLPRPPPARSSLVQNEENSTQTAEEQKIRQASRARVHKLAAKKRLEEQAEARKKIVRRGLTNMWGNEEA